MLFMVIYNYKRCLSTKSGCACTLTDRKRSEATMDLKDKLNYLPGAVVLSGSLYFLWYALSHMHPGM